MKKLVLMAFFISAPLFAQPMDAPQKDAPGMYQDLCAKERDPVKRQNYCYLIENNTRLHTQSNAFRLDTAIV